MNNLKLSYLGKKINFHFYDRIPSTNEKVWDLINDGADFPLVAIAKCQTKGKGQRGNKWVSSQGGLYLSLGLGVNLSVDDATHLTLFTAWGIADNLRKYNIPVQIKWLNDLILNRKKLGGILCETKIKNQVIYQAVIGVGINWQNQVPTMGINLKSVLNKDEKCLVNSLEDLILITVQGILNGYEFYCQNGIEKLIKAYEEIFYNLGQEIIIEVGKGIITGISDKGELKVKLTSQGASTEIFLASENISLGYS